MESSLPGISVFDPELIQRFEQAFSRVRTLVDRRLGKDEAKAFKVALATHLGGIIANASGRGDTGLGRLSEDELQAITAIAIWLGTEPTQ